MVDFADNAELKAAIESFYAAGKLVAADCHGPIVLCQCVKPDGSPLVEGLACTAFTDSEEAAVGQTATVPFLLEVGREDTNGRMGGGSGGVQGGLGKARDTRAAGEEGGGFNATSISTHRGMN